MLIFGFGDEKIQPEGLKIYSQKIYKMDKRKSKTTY